VNISWDASEVNRLATDLSKAPGRIQRAAPKTLRKGAFDVKQRLRRDAEGHAYLPGLAAKAAYSEFNPLSYEIGFDKDGQGHLGNVAVYGTSNNAPIMSSPADHLRLELPTITRHLGDDGEDSVFGGAR
jgi:hypothetical protein